MIDLPATVAQVDIEREIGDRPREIGGKSGTDHVFR